MFIYKFEIFFHLDSDNNFSSFKSRASRLYISVNLHAIPNLGISRQNRRPAEST